MYAIRSYYGECVADDVEIQRYSEQATYFAAFMQQVSYVLLVAFGAWIRNNFV